MRLFYLLLVVLCANEFLDFGPWWHIQGKFNIADVGNILSWLGVGLFLFRRGVPKFVRNPFSILIISYLVFVGIQISLGSLYYDQSLIFGLLGARHQFYFLSFFLFLFLLDSPAQIHKFLNILTVVALIAVVLGIINYFGPVILYHKWAEGQRVRSGITRAFIPAMAVVSFAVLWEMNKWIMAPRRKMSSGVQGWLLVGAHVFRQTRMRLFGIVAVIAGMLVLKRKFGYLLIAAFISISAIIIVGFIFEENIILSLFSSAADNLVHKSGSWQGRAIQLQTDIKHFLEHPLIGSGTSTLRVDLTSGSVSSPSELEQWSLAYKDDLGYTHWLKSYGIVGMIWLLSYFYLLWHQGRYLMRKANKNLQVIASFTVSYTAFVIGTFITLNHMMFPYGIVLICLLTAIIVRMKYFVEAEDEQIAPS